jgi:bifunctional DNA-binding transcriptional regulator/antitoxin component of YhaV-PrlF toxin-antitoxin module
MVRTHLGIGPGSAAEFDLTATGEVVVKPAAPRRGRKGPARDSRFARLRGRATVKMRTDEIMALTRG